ncbi:DUF6884 domain-containing protein [Streptomyces triticirhizae]|uniref:DUF6884 domain-containing protein n=1 Tax=Streptomyces triticirhizae TaxID=2483353 RepID=A0A3M2MB71_9ACTN|nr:DUF6884 domain-containing protein [Streptomyces triticirhizae]RMI46752.1 hypothetical protein EBN88_00540 [Streptomyces triticirhizae]
MPPHLRLGPGRIPPGTRISHLAHHGRHGVLIAIETAAARWRPDIPCGARKARAPFDSTPLPAGQMYTGPYNRAARRAADALTDSGHAGRILILSARYGLLDPAEAIRSYDLRLGAPGSITTEQLRQQADDLTLNGALVTVLAGRTYTDLVRSVFPDAHTPLAGARGIGDHLSRLAHISRATTPTTPTTLARSTPRRAGR